MEPVQFDLETLEFRVVRELLTERLETALGRHLVQALGPLGTAAEANAALEEAREIAVRLAEEDRPPLGSAVELRSWLAAFFAGEHQPETRDIADLKRLLRCALSCKSWLRAREGQQALWGMAEAFPDVRALFEELENVVDDRGEVLSSASLRLDELRREIESSEGAVRAAAASYAGREELRRCLQSTEPSWRHGRPVLQVRQEFRHMVPGILHDRSQSGATLFVEPSCVVELANRLSDARAAEHREIQVVLAQICRGLRRCREEVDASLAAIERLDLAQARAKLIHVDGYYAAPVVASGVLRLRRALHPILLSAQNEVDALVPLDITLGDPYRMIVVTGPNTGGKTVVLKTVGLLALMALSGIPIPAQEGSQIPDLDGIFADIGDAQGISQNLSTFSAHVTRIARCLHGATERSLVLLDELGAGTDPEEGGSLGYAVLEAFEERRSMAVVTTHLGQLKDFAYSNEGTENGSMSFDGETLSPLYRLEIGIPGTSHALDIAGRVGMPADLVRRARELLGRQDLGLEEVIGQVQKARVQAEDARQRTEELRGQAETRERELQVKHQEIDRRQAWLEEEADSLVAEQLGEVRDRLEATLKDFGNAPKPFGERAQELRRELSELLRARSLHRRRMRFLGELRKGSRVWVPTFHKLCLVKKVDRARDLITIEAGSMRLEIPFEDISWLQPIDPRDKN